MPYSNECEHEERKVSLDDVLLYSSTEPQVVNVSTLGQEIESELWDACANGNLGMVKKILETNNISVNARLRSKNFEDNSKKLFEMTPLMIAANYDQKILIDFLLKQSEINISIETGGEMDVMRTALDFALLKYEYSAFGKPNYEAAATLIKAGADINKVYKITYRNAFPPLIHHRTLLLHAWYLGDRTAVANELVTLLGASIHKSEQVFFASNRERIERNGEEGVPQQIALSKKHLKEYMDDAKRLGVDIGLLCTRSLSKDLSFKLAEFIFKENSFGMRAFKAGVAELNTPHNRSQPFTFMRTRQSEIYNQKSVAENTGQDHLSNPKKEGDTALGL